MQRSKWTLIIVLSSVAALLIIPPIAMGTTQYPVVIVSGISMLPTLHGGDLVVLRGVPPNTIIPNRTIIAYSPQQLGIPLIDSFTAPIIIHRIVRVYDVNGSVSYTTKGDNNRVVDSPNVDPDQIIGEEAAVIPYVGTAFLFVGSPQGLVVVVALMVFFYIGVYENQLAAEKRKNIIIIKLTSMFLENKLTTEEYNKFKAIVETSTTTTEPGHPLAVWLQKHSGHMTIETGQCPTCGTIGLRLGSRGGKESRFICPRCDINHVVEDNPKTAEDGK